MHVPAPYSRPIHKGGRLKLADFGMATVYGKGAEGLGDGQEGDTLYMAKELLSSTERLPSADMFRCATCYFISLLALCRSFFFFMYILSET